MIPDIIDTHSHFYPRWYLDMLGRRSEIPRVVNNGAGERFVIFPGERGRPIDQAYWDLDSKLAFMDRLGISRTVLSLGNPWLDPFTGDGATETARQTNGFFAGLEQETAGRIVGMGALPASDVEAAAVTVHEIASTDGLYGVIVSTRICGKRLDDPELNPLWEAFHNTRLPMFLHPHYTVAREELDGFGHALPVALGFTFETTLALTRLVLAGVLQRYPRMKIVASHGGGTIPFLLGRLDAAWRSDPSIHARLPVPPSEDLSRVYFDGVLYHAAAFRATAEIVGTRRMPWGTDHPFSVSDPAASLSAVAAAFDQSGQHDVLRRSAQEAFGLGGADV